MAPWLPVPYERWRATLDTVHALPQVLGKLAVALAPAEPQLQHAALRLSARGWETQPLPAPDGSGAIVVTVDLHAHATLIEHSDGGRSSIPLTPDRSVGAVTNDVLTGVRRMAGPLRFDARPQETAWSVPLDEDDEHATYDEAQVQQYLAAATHAAGVLARLRAPYRGARHP